MIGRGGSSPPSDTIANHHKFLTKLVDIRLIGRVRVGHGSDIAPSPSATGPDFSCTAACPMGGSDPDQETELPASSDSRQPQAGPLAGPAIDHLSTPLKGRASGHSASITSDNRYARLYPHRRTSSGQADQSVGVRVGPVVAALSVQVPGIAASAPPPTCSRPKGAWGTARSGRPAQLGRSADHRCG
jgi:hypothetical protein